ncbi:MAG: 2-succinyl-6-hydroxy-2,4-cyclohexadiene-1-carboxylate synthase [Desulfobacterales bacterium]|nr:2-succinyl-6-hydroxy-2,4-cyclohexadiene-1-carboxylate synthase [Desulfobacterales bacterium]
MGESSDWLEVTERFENEYYCILPDLPGHGKSISVSAADPLDFDFVALGLVNLMEGLRLPAAVLIGYSMGGRVALHTAIKYRKRFKALVLEGASPGIRDDNERNNRLILDEERAKEMEKVGMARYPEIWYEAELFSTLKRHPEKLDKIKAARRSNDASWMAKVLRELSPGRQAPLWDKLATLDMPVLLIAGDLDHKYKKIAHEMKGCFKDSQVRLMPGAGHNTHLEAPEEFGLALASFLTAS